MAKRYNNFFLEEEKPKIYPDYLTNQQPDTSTIDLYAGQIPGRPIEQTQPEASPEPIPATVAQPTSPVGQPQVTQALPTTDTPSDYKLGEGFNEKYNPPLVESTDPQLAPATATEQPTSAIKYPVLADFEAEVAQQRSPLHAFMKATTPVLDEKKQNRLKRIAAVNSIGKGLGTIFQGYYGKKGATITPDNSTLLPETYKEYTANLDEYEAKKNLWNKDMMALSLGDAAEAQRRFENSENKRLAIEQYDKQVKTAMEAEQRQRDFQTKMSELDKDFQLKIYNAKSAVEQEQFKKQLAQQKELTYAGFAHDNDMLTARLTAAEEKAKADAKAAALKAGIVNRQPGTETYPFGFTNSKGQQVALKAEQLTIVEDLMNRAEGDGMSLESMNNKKRFEAMRKDGKISESEARDILNKYFDKYYTLEGDEAIFKGEGEVKNSNGWFSPVEK